MNKTYRWISVIAAFVIPLGRLLASAAPVAAQEPDCRTVREALQAGEITLSLNANESEFYNEPLTYIVRNIVGQQVEFCFPAGMMMIAGDGGYQDLVLTRTVILLLGPGDQREGRLAAMCANLSKDAPISGSSYEPGAMASGDVLSVALAIDRNSAQGSLGAQLAMWAVTDGFTLEDLGGGSESESAEMFQLIAPLLCLTKDELELGQRLLEEADVDARLFAGDSQSGLAFCERLGVPTDINQIMLILARYSVLALCCCGGGCGLTLVVVAAGVFLIARSRRKA
jgi:hypothetical protein